MATSRLHNLPQAVTSFIGRERELVDVTELLAKHRLVTLTGAGGCGKTRLALGAAARLTGAFRDGVRWVELSALSDPVLLSQVVAARIGLKGRGRPTTDALAQFLGPKSMLLILDTCEHIRLACAMLAHALLTEAPDLRLLATSRELLNVPGEITYRVPSLSHPDRDQPATRGALSAFESVRLFVERAATRQPGFVLSEANAAEVGEICRRLDGIPLAIELAAARMHILSVEQLAGHLREQFEVLGRESAVVLPRHRTLRKTFDWSHDLLDDEERMLFRRASVFAGGFTLEAAETVCGASLESLGRLADKSMVQTDPSRPVARYRLLDMMREFAREKLAAAGEVEVVSGRHRDYFLRLAQEAEPHLTASDEQEWLERLDVEHDNLRAALRHRPSDGAASEANLRAAAALRRFWFARGYITEGRVWLENGLREAVPCAPSVRVKALNAIASLAWRQGDFVQGRAWANEALDLARAAGDRCEVSNALHELGTIAYHEGNRTRAKSLWEECLALRRDLGMAWHAGITLLNLGEMAYADGEYRHAVAFLREGLALFEQIRNPSGMAWMLRNLGAVLSQLGAYSESLAYFRRGIELHRGLGYQFGIAGGLDGLATSAAKQRRTENAAWILGAADALHERVGIPRQPEMATEMARVREMIRATLGETAYAAAAARGRELPLEQVLQRVLAGDPFRGAMTPLQARLLGEFEVRREGAVLPSTVWRRKRNRLLFVYLLLAGRPVPREELLDALWPDLSRDAAAASLNVAWSNLKRVFEPDLAEGEPSSYLAIERGRYGLQPAAVVTDVREFERQAAGAANAARPEQRTAALERAASIYTGDLLPDDTNEPWTVLARERLRTQYLGVLESLAESQRRQNRAEDAIETLRTILRLEPWREETYRSLMDILVTFGRRSEALRVYRDCETLLRRELNVAPSLETQALAKAIGGGDQAP